MKAPIAIVKKKANKSQRLSKPMTLILCTLIFCLSGIESHAQRKKKKEAEPKWKTTVDEIMRIPLEDYQVMIDSIWLNPFHKFPLNEEVKYVGSVQLNGWTKYMFTERNLSSDRRFTVIGKGDELIYGQVDYVLNHRMGSCGHVNVSEERYFNGKGEVIHKQILQFDSDCYEIKEMHVDFTSLWRKGQLYRNSFQFHELMEDMQQCIVPMQPDTVLLQPYEEALMYDHYAIPPHVYFPILPLEEYDLVFKYEIFSGLTDSNGKPFPTLFNQGDMYMRNERFAENCEYLIFT
ncbi:MAG: hypothetical protein HRT74_10075, partial [Flavobacteriales bacterium]|nr:hypothetical protein [Flavobacteriales bacterium]